MVLQRQFCRAFHCLISSYAKSGFYKHRLRPSCTLLSKAYDQKTFCQSQHQYSTNFGGFLAQHLEEKTLLRISGQDASDFLQGLVTNDMECLNYDREQCGGSLYSFLLNVQGRVMYDMILYGIGKRKNLAGSPMEGPSILLECSSDVSSDLFKQIKRYRLRKKVELAPNNEYSVWAIFPSNPYKTELSPPEAIDSSNILMLEPDPRLKHLGFRLVLPAGVKASDVLSDVSETKDPSLYMQHRYKLGVAEGSKELPTGGCLPLEYNAAFINGVSFNKGCYIGQELTARTYHTGLTRKRIMPVTLEKEIKMTDKLTIHNASDKKSGTLRGCSGLFGIGLLRIPDIIGKGPLSLKNEDEEILTTVAAHIPSWWQTDADQILKQVIVDFPDEFNRALQ